MSFVYVTSLMAAVTTAGDGVGTSVTAGPDFTISNGTVSGTNLFHSFNQFNLTSTESATFTYGGMGAIDNVIGRILGGASSIDGTVGFDGTLPSANLFLINPAGIVFGPNAQLNVPGSFHASTADYVSFTGGDTWGAAVPATQTLSTAAPAAFGFLNDASFNSVTVQSGASLSVATNQTLSLVGSGLTVTNADLTAESGQVNLVSVASAGLVSSLSGTPSAPGIGGSVSITDSTIDVSGTLNETGDNGAGGSVYIKGGSLTLDNSSVFAIHYSDTVDAGDFDFQATGALNLTDSFVYSGANFFFPSSGGDADSGDINFDAGTFSATNTLVYSLTGGASPSGNITVSADDGVTEVYDFAGGTYPTAMDADIVIDNSNFYSAALSTANYSMGSPGYIFLFSDSLYMTGGNLYASTFSPTDTASAGYVYLLADYAHITNSSQIHTDTDGAADAGYILFGGNEWLVDGGTSITSDATSSATTGNAGDIRIIVDDFELDNASMATSYAGTGNGNAGVITVDNCFIFCSPSPTNSFTLSNGATLLSEVVNGAGSAGDITILTDALTVQGGSSISSSSDQAIGAAGNVEIDSDTVVIDNSSISSDTHDGIGGFIDIDAAVSGMVIADATISTNTDGDGDAGGIFLSGGDWTLSGVNTQISSSQTSNGDYMSGGGIGDAGDILVNVSSLSMSDSASILSSTSSDATGPVGSMVEGLVSDAGNITITASDGIDDAMTNDLSLTGTISIVDYITFEFSGIIFNFPIFAPTIPTIASNSEDGIGNAGSITINTGTASINGGLVFANTNAGLGGNIEVNADYLDATNLTLTADTLGAQNAGNISFGSGLIDGDWTLSSSTILSNARAGSTGNAGQIGIDLDTLMLDGNTVVATNTDVGAQGNAGRIDVDTTGTLTVTGDSSIASITAAGMPMMGVTTPGNAGAIDITANTLNVTAGGSVSSSSNNGTGAAGDITILANTFMLDGGAITSETSSGLDNDSMDPMATAIGVISITANTGTITNTGDPRTLISASTTGTGDAGNVNLLGGTWTISGDAVDDMDPMVDSTEGIGSTIIASSTFGSGDAGAVNIDVGSLTINNFARVATLTDDTTTGNAGNISLTADTSVSVNTGAQVISSTGNSSTGNAGSITITTEADAGDVGGDTVTLASAANISSSAIDGSGAAGTISITTDVLLIDGAIVTSETSTGFNDDAGSPGIGSISLNALATGTITNTGADKTLVSANTGGSGTAGDINITGDTWVISGDVVADADGSELLGSTVVTSSTSSTGDAGTVNIDVNDITITDYAQVTTSTSLASSGGDAGDVTVAGDTSVLISNHAEVTSTSSGDGAAGTVTVTTENGMAELANDTLTIDGGAVVSSSATADGAAGDLVITTDDFYLDGTSITSETVDGIGGSITITANNTGTVTNTVADATVISASTSGMGNAGDIRLLGGTWTISGDVVANADGSELLGSTEISSSTSDTGRAGRILIDVASLTIDDYAIVKTETTSTGNAGNIALIADTDVLLDNNAVVSSSSLAGGSGNAGNILVTTENVAEVGDVDTDTVTLQANALVTSSSEMGTSTGSGTGNPGQITINTDIFSMTGAQTEINTTNNAGPDVGPGLGNGVISITAASGTINATSTVGDASEIKANTVGDGNAGAIQIDGGSWTIYGTSGFAYPNYQAQISTSQTNAMGLGDAGGIIFNVDYLALLERGKIESSTNSLQTTADAGKILLNIDDGIDDAGTVDLLMTGGIAQIYSNSTGNGAAGDIEINTGTMNLVTADIFAQNHNGPGGTITIDADHATVQSATYIKTDTDGTGDAGNINLVGGDWNITGSNQITSTSTGVVPMAGDAGNIRVDVDTLIVDSFSRISTSTGVNDANAGTILLQAATSIDIQNTTVISSDSSSGTGDAGSITVTAPLVTIDDSTLSTTINSGTDGSGAIAINAAMTNINNGANITASTIGDANAGSISFTGNTLNINTTSMVASSSDGAATADAGIVDIDVTTLNLDTGAQVGTNSSTTGAAGDIDVQVTTTNITGGAILSSSSAAGTGDAGSITINAQDFTVDGAGSSVNTVINNGTDASGAIAITATTGDVTNGGEISAGTVGNSDAGSVSLLGGTWTVASNGVVTSSADAGIATTDAGQITVDVTSLTVETGGQVKTDTGMGSLANAGDVSITANDVTIQTGGEVSSSSAEGTGAAGSVTITTPILVMNDGEITTETNDGPGGTITLAANTATISNMSDITADTEGMGGAGDIVITGDLWTIESGSVISSDSQDGTGTAGNINMTVGDIIIDNATVSTITNASQGGTITLHATNVSTGYITNGGQVFADTVGTGNAGDVFLIGNWIIDGAGIVSSSSLLNGAMTNLDTGGSAGTINISGDNFVLNGATITTNSDTSGAAGSITISTGLISIANGANISSNTDYTGGGGQVTLNSGSDIFLSGGSTISTTTSYAPGGGNAGNININAIDSLYMDTSVMTSSTTGDGDAGSIFINTGEYTYLLDSTVFADADTLFNVGGGNLTVDTGILVLDSSTLDVSSNFDTGGNVTINADYVFFTPDSVIDVSSTFGASGTVSVNAVAVDLSGGLNSLKIKFQDAGTLLRQSCNVAGSTSSSSFVVENGVDGIPRGPDDLQYGSILDVEYNSGSNDQAAYPAAPGAAPLTGSALFPVVMCGGL